MDSGLSSRINLVILDGAHDFRSTFNTGSDEICKQVRLVALFGRDRRVGECLLLREERKSGLRGPISVFDPQRTLGRRDLTLQNRYAGPEPFERLSSFWAAI